MYCRSEVVVFKHQIPKDPDIQTERRRRRRESEMDESSAAWGWRRPTDRANWLGGRGRRMEGRGMDGHGVVITHLTWTLMEHSTKISRQ